LPRLVKIVFFVLALCPLRRNNMKTWQM
jgi:hypothetical protein